MRRGIDIPACRWLLAAIAICPSYAAALPLSSAATEPQGDWLAASVAVENADQQDTFPGLRLLAELGEDWQAGVRVPFESGTPTTRWSDARRHGELVALRRFVIAPRLHGTAAAGASFNSGDTTQFAHFFTGSVLGLRVRHTIRPWLNALGVALQQFEPRRDGSRPGDIWSLRLATGRYLRSPTGSWSAGAALDGEIYLPGTDTAGIETSEGRIWFLGADITVERGRWRIAGAVQAAVDDNFPAGEVSAGHRVQLQLSYGLGAPP
jgi:hypothetical protein